MPSPLCAQKLASCSLALSIALWPLAGCGGEDSATDEARAAAGGAAGQGGQAGQSGGSGQAGQQAGGSGQAGQAGQAGGGASQGGSGQAGGAGATTSGSGGVVSPSDLSTLESETHLAVGPGGAVAVAWIGILPEGSHIGYTFSADDGATFGAVQKIDAPDGRESSDPVLAFDADGSAYITWVAFHRTSSDQPVDMAVYVAKAPAGSQAFGEPVEVTDPAEKAQYDKPWLTITRQGTLLVTYARTSTGAIFAATSKDASTWKRSLIVQDQGYRNLVFPCVGKTTDRVWATYHAGGGIGLRWSDDDGLTWPDANKTAVAQQGEQPAFQDPSCAAEGDEVWVTYGLSDDPPGTEKAAKLKRIRLAHSGDGGKTIDWRADAHDPSAGKYAMLPYLVREDSGALDLVYYAGDSEGGAGTFRRSRAEDAKTFGPSVVLDDQVVFEPSRGSPQWLGDYVGLSTREGKLYASYVVNQKYAHVAFRRAILP